MLTYLRYKPQERQNGAVKISFGKPLKIDTLEKEEYQIGKHNPEYNLKAKKHTQLDNLAPKSDPQ